MSVCAICGQPFGREPVTALINIQSPSGFCGAPPGLADVKVQTHPGIA